MAAKIQKLFISSDRHEGLSHIKAYRNAHNEAYIEIEWVDGQSLHVALDKDTLTEFIGELADVLNDIIDNG